MPKIEKILKKLARQDAIQLRNLRTGETVNFQRRNTFHQKQSGRNRLV
jgi:hypothetical protein